MCQYTLTHHSQCGHSTLAARTTCRAACALPTRFRPLLPPAHVVYRRSRCFRCVCVHGAGLGLGLGLGLDGDGGGEGEGRVAGWMLAPREEEEEEGDEEEEGGDDVIRPEEWELDVSAESDREAEEGEEVVDGGWVLVR